MRVGVLSDIHANLVALETVLADIGQVDALWVCGDTVGYGPDPSDVLALLVERKATLVAGNHDRAVATGRTSTSSIRPRRSRRRCINAGSPPRSATCSRPCHERSRRAT